MARARKTGPGGNRTDLLARPQAVAAPTGLPYGENQQLQQAQKAQPLPGQPPAPSPQQLALQGAEQAKPPPLPIHAPTERPNEPLTTGLASGAGAGPEVMNGGLNPDPTVSLLQGIYSRYPSPDIAALITEAQARSRATTAGAG